MTARRLLAAVALIFAIAFAALCAGSVWLLTTESGLRTAVRLAGTAFGEHLHIAFS